VLAAPQLLNAPLNWAEGASSIHRITGHMLSAAAKAQSKLWGGLSKR